MLKGKECIGIGVLTFKIAYRVVDLCKVILEDAEVFVKVLPLKFNLYDWYCRNLIGYLTEYAERYEYVEICRKLNLITANTVMGKVTFKGNVIPDEQKPALDMTGMERLFCFPPFPANLQSHF